MGMDPDRYQMRDLKRRMSKLEDQIGYLKTDWKRSTVKLNDLIKDVQQLVRTLGHDLTNLDEDDLED